MFRGMDALRNSMLGGVYALRNIFADRVGDIPRRVLDDLCSMLHAMLDRAHTLRRFVGDILRTVFDGMGALRHDMLRCVDTFQHIVVNGVRDALRCALDRMSSTLDGVHALDCFVSDVLRTMFNGMHALCDFMGGGTAERHATFCRQLGYLPACG